MRVLLLNHFFHPDGDAVAQLATDLAEDLVAAGHQVTALAARGGYRGGQRLPPRETWRGVEIVRAGGTSFGKRSIVGRLADYATFFAAALFTALTLPRHDVVLATSAPPLVATIGALLRAVKGTRFVYWLQDVYPELAVEFSVLRARSPATWAFERLSRATLRRADGVVVLGEAMAERVRAKGVVAERIHTIPNWADGAGIHPVAHQDNPFRRDFGFSGKRVVLYSGNMGRGHDLTTLLEAARRLRDEPDLLFAFVGDGAKRPQVEAAARELPSVRLFPFQPRERLAESLSAGDLHVVTMDPCTLGLLEPSKLYGVLAAGRPVLFIGPAKSEVARTIVREGVGEVVANGDVDGAVKALRAIMANAAALGTRARAAFDRGYGRPERTQAFEELLCSVVAR
jgi:glycosyltransferase involved in cell wall biosynthesis